MSEIKKEVLEVSEAYSKGLKLGEEGVITPEEGLYASLLKSSPVDVVREKVDTELLEGLQEHNTIHLAGLAHRVSTIGNHAMKKDDSLNKVTLQLPTIGKDTFNVTYDRSQQVNAGAPGDKDAGTRTKYGILRVSVDTHSTGNRGQLAAVKTFASDEAAKLLGDKWISPAAAAIEAAVEVAGGIKESLDEYRESTLEEAKSFALRRMRNQHDPFKKYDHLSDEEFEARFPNILKVQWW